MKSSPEPKASLAALKATYTDKKRAFDRENPYVYFVMRPLSWVPTWICLRLGITANGATWIGLFIGIAACAAFAWGGFAGFLAGALLYNLFFLFDHIDGNIARWHRNTNHYGKFIDGVFGAVLVMLLLLAVGVGVYRTGAGPSPVFGALLAFLSAAVVIFRYYISLRVEFAFHQAAAAEAASASAAAGGPSGNARSPLGILKGFLLKIEQSTLEGSILVLAAFGVFDWWIWIFGPLYILNSLIESARSLSLARRKLNVYRPF